MTRARCRLSEHLSLEIEASRPGEPLGEGQPVLGCTCYRCIIGTFGLRDEARIVAEDLVRDLARLDPAIRRNAASAVVVSHLADGLRLPSAAILAELARRVGGSRASEPNTRGEGDLPIDLHIDAARAVPILAVARGLEIKLRRIGKSWRGPCPIHGGDGPNFSIDPARGIFKCFVCDAGGDAIALEQQVAGITFPDAVRRLAG